jgi:hypothetical protein
LTLPLPRELLGKLDVEESRCLVAPPVQHGLDEGRGDRPELDHAD